MLTSIEQSDEFALIESIAVRLRAELGNQMEDQPGFRDPADAGQVNRAFRAAASVILRTIALPDEKAKIGPVPMSVWGRKHEPGLDRPSNIIRSFNELFGDIEWKDADKTHQVITGEIPAKVADDEVYQNAKKNSDRQNARIALDSALQRVMMELLGDHTEFFKQFSDDPRFKKWLSDAVFQSTDQERSATSPRGTR